MGDTKSSSSWSLVSIAWIAAIIMGIAKLIGLFPYSWWVVFAPLIIAFGLSLGILLFVLIVAGLSMLGVWLFAKKLDKKKKQ